MRDIVDVRKVYKDGNLNRRFVGLVTLHLLPVAIPSGSCQKRKEKETSLQMFFNNEISIRYCLKLLGI